MASLAEVLEFDYVQKEIASYCAFSLGKQRIFDLVPALSKLLAKDRLAKMNEALKVAIALGDIPLGGLSDIRNALIQSQKDQIIRPSDLLQIVSHGEACERVKAFFAQEIVEAPLLSDYSEALVHSPALNQAILAAIEPGGVIKENATPLLASLHRQVRLTQERISSEAQRFVKTHASQLSETVTVLRNDRLVVLAKASEKNNIKGYYHGASSSGASVYIEPEILVELNNQLSDFLSQIEAEEERILRELSQKVKEVADQYLANLETLAILDEYNAKAQWTKVRDGVVAELNEEGRLYLKAARHPLIDSQKVVANTYQIQRPKRMILITGPNTGGKTVSLKVIGLFVYMTLCGCGILCDEAEIPLVEGIYADLGDDQSIVQSLSTYSAHVKKLTQITAMAKPDSLVLLDELGSGTDPKEGESLAVGVLEYLRQLGCLVVVTTHFSALKNYGKAHDEIAMAAVGFDLTALSPTYHIHPDSTGLSYGLEIARKLGLKADILKTANAVAEAQKTKSDRLLEQLEKEREILKETQDEAKAHLESIKEQETYLQNQRELWEVKKEKILQEAQSEANRIKEEASQEAEELLNKLKAKNTIKPQEIGEFNQEIEGLAKAAETVPLAHSFAVGETVRIAGTSRQGVITAITGDKAQLEIGSLSIHSPLAKLEFVPSPKKQAKKILGASYSVSRPRVSAEINVIGKTASEAIQEVGKYLDDALLANLASVRVIHGYGTGTLRKAIWAYLDKCPSVKDYYPASSGEGAGGATIVALGKKS
ncbi:MAG: Smr/MutS family protein [Erysipelotrichaceae bacterium]|jgi:DNA mismatch repair protein MutS2|nr:Smr/MutS family protein [Erysipelotrichaceae bacterium]